MFTCTICTRFVGKSFAAVLRHIGTAHRYDPGLSIKCGIMSCPGVYTNFESFRSHVYRKHREELFLSNGESSCNTEDASQDDGVLMSENSRDVFNAQPTIHSGGDSLKLNAAKFLLKTKEECKLTQASLDAIVSGVKGLWSQAMDDLKEKMREVLPETCNVFDDLIFTASPFDGLETQYFQEKFYRENFGYIVSSKLMLKYMCT